LAIMTVGGMVLIPSARARGWLKLKLAKHLFEPRYDYRAAWLRFTETLGLAGPEAPPLSERIVRAFADIVDAPGGLLLVSDGGRRLGGRPLGVLIRVGTGVRGSAVATASDWPGASPCPDAFDDAIDFWTELEASPRIV